MQKWTSEHVALWAEMYARLMTIDEISAATGASVERIWSKFKEHGIPLRPKNKPSKPAKLRFDRKWTPEPNTGCWLWKHGTHKFGYGFFKHAGEVTAHRVSWVLHNGPIPDGMHVLHRCDVPQCVNPDHLFLGTHTDNMKDCARKGRTQRYNTTKTHCPKGHPYAGDNLLLRSDSGRSCRECIRVRANKYRRNNLEAARARDRRAYWAKKEQQNA